MKCQCPNIFRVTLTSDKGSRASFLFSLYLNDFECFLCKKCNECFVKLFVLLPILTVNIEIIQLYVLKKFVLLSRDFMRGSLCRAVIIHIILRSWSCDEFTQAMKIVMNIFRLSFNCIITIRYICVGKPGYLEKTIYLP